MIFRTLMSLTLQIISTLATLLIGIAASLLAYRQYKISHTKLQFDLYEKRLALFLKVRQFVDEIGRKPVDPTRPEDNRTWVRQFFNDSIEHRFLFDDPAITEYFEVLRKKAMELTTTRRLQQQNEQTAEDAMALNESETELRLWFNAQPDDMLWLFQKHLSLKTLA